MQEAVSKTGVYDIFNDFPYTMPDAAGAKVIIPLDDYAKKYQARFLRRRRRPQVPAVLRRQALHDGQRRRPSADGAAQGPGREPAGERRIQGQVRQGPRLPRHGCRMGAAGRVLPDQGGRHALGHQVRQGPVGRARLPLGQLLLPALPGLHEGASVRQGHEAAHHHAGRHPGHQGLRRGRRLHAQGHPGLGHAADLSLLGQRARLLGHVVSLHLRVRREQPQQRRQGQAARLPDPGPHGRRQARAPLAAGRRHRLHGERLRQEPGARLPLHPVVHEPEHRRRGRRPSRRASGIRSACRT